MQNNKLFLYVLMVLCFSSLVFADNYINPLTIGIADQRYCMVDGTCTLDNLILQNLSVIGDILNVSVVNYNVTGDIYIDGNITGIDKITFRLGEIIDNIIDGWIRLTGNVNVTGDLDVGGDLNADGISANSFTGGNANFDLLNIFGQTNLYGGLDMNGTRITRQTYQLQDTAGLVSYYPFENVSGGAEDYVGDNNGVNNGATFTFDGRVGSGRDFDGNDFINIDDVRTALASTTKGTFSAWVKPVDATPTGGEIIIGFGDTNDRVYMLFYIVASGQLFMETRSLAGIRFILKTSAAVFSDNTWTHVAVVQDGTEPVLYIDGVAVAQEFQIANDKTFWFSQLSALDNGRIGDFNYWSAGESNYFNGGIDEVKFYNRSISPQEITYLHQQDIKHIDKSVNITIGDDVLFVDVTNKRVAFGTNIPKKQFHLSSPTAANWLFEDTGAAANERKKVISVDGGIMYFGKFSDAFDFTAQMVIDNDGNVLPGTTETYSFGSSTLRWLKGWFLDLDVDGNITAENVFTPQYIFSHTNETMVLLGANTWTNVTFGQENADLKQGIEHDMTTLNHTFTITEDGVYFGDYEFDVEDTSGVSTDIDVGGRLIYVNGTEVIGSDHETGIAKKGIEVELTYDFLFKAYAGDQFVFQFIATDADVVISTHGTFGEHPESAAIIIKKEANLP